MDKSLIDLPNMMSREYMDGINHFMEFTNGFDNEFISCPCRKCANRYYYKREFVREHLILNRFLKQYKNWIRHGEEYVPCRREERDEIEVDDMSETDSMIAMLNDIACGLAPEYTSCEIEGAGETEVSVVLKFSVMFTAIVCVDCCTFLFLLIDKIDH
ncbi:hypothetical protein MRB53_017484 [Persea americana]|uniref:Uncharacterized protein n=1 Tax=Persea americana TaxID=3435 RepID=A0ACC2M568_PERAE|nr:hypothetical protein MRB53_017484 [Persea americana]